jgi:protease I
MKIFRYNDFIKESNSNKSAVILTGEGFQDAELFDPKSALEKAGYNVVVTGIETGEIKAYNSDKMINIEKLVSELNPNDYDILILPGGKAPDKIRKDNNVISFVKNFYKTGKKIAAICHGPQILVTANIVDGIEMTCYPDMKSELIEAGANYVDKELIVDGQFITSRNPNDLSVFCKEIIK